MNIPEAAIEAAATQIGHDNFCDSRNDGCTCGLDDRARATIEAAMPAIREALAQEIEAKITRPKNIWDDDGHYRQDNYKEAARIIRGGTS